MKLVEVFEILVMYGHILNLKTCIDKFPNCFSSCIVIVKESTDMGQVSDILISLLVPFTVIAGWELFCAKSLRELYAVSSEAVCPKRRMASDSVQFSNRIQRSMRLPPLPSA